MLINQMYVCAFYIYVCSTLAIMDNNGDKRLTKDELKYGLQDYGIELNIREMDEIFNYFGTFPNSCARCVCGQCGIVGKCRSWMAIGTFSAS